MSAFSCKICFHSYNENITPRILGCGHTFCCDCLTSLLLNNKRCPVCRQDFSFKTATDYPINYIVLEMCEVAVDKEFQVECLKKKINELSDKHKDILKIKPFFEKLPIIEENNKKLDEWIANSDVIIDNINAVTNTVIGMEKFIKELSTCKLINFRRNFDIYGKHFDTTHDFIKKIYNDLYNNKCIVAITKVDCGEEKMSKFSICEDKLLLDSLCVFKKGDFYQTVRFKDSRNAMLDYGFWSQKLHAFFDFSTKNDNVPLTRRVFIQLLTESDMCSLFLSLCTGEKGISYLGCSCNKKSYHYKIPRKRDDDEYYYSQTVYNNKEDVHLETLSLDISQNWQEKYKQYFSRVKNINVNSAKYALNFNYDGSFRIYPIVPDSINNKETGIKIGVVIEEDNFKINVFLNSANELKIINCGIAIKM